MTNIGGDIGLGVCLPAVISLVKIKIYSGDHRPLVITQIPLGDQNPQAHISANVHSIR
jgi:hypothetical protein